MGTRDVESIRLDVILLFGLGALVTVIGGLAVLGIGVNEVFTAVDVGDPWLFAGLVTTIAIAFIGYLAVG